MDDEWVVDWRRLGPLRDRWRKRDPASGTVPSARLAVRAQVNFGDFVDFVAGEWAGPECPPKPALAMVFFGPRGSAPREIWDAYLAVDRRVSADTGKPQPFNPFDLMLAFGCGWGRVVRMGEGQWWGRWEMAYATMINQVRASLIVTNRLLGEQFPQFQLSPDDILEFPGDFTVSLLGACDCGHHSRGCRKDCGRGCCFAPHDLGTWDPGVCHLRPFIDQAVRGTATRQILGGAFAESLTFRTMEREGRILRRRVEFKCCPRCDHRYEEASCPQPGCDAPEGRAVRRVARPNWLIRPEHEGGNYREMIRWVCGGCENIYPIPVHASRAGG